MKNNPVVSTVDRKAVNKWTMYKYLTQSTSTQVSVVFLVHFQTPTMCSSEYTISFGIINLPGFFEGMMILLGSEFETMDTTQHVVICVQKLPLSSRWQVAFKKTWTLAGTWPYSQTVNDENGNDPPPESSARLPRLFRKESTQIYGTFFNSAHASSKPKTCSLALACHFVENFD